MENKYPVKITDKGSRRTSAGYKLLLQALLILSVIVFASDSLMRRDEETCFRL